MPSKWLPVDQLEVGHLYRLSARRQSFGIWNGSDFVGVQWEFGSPTLSHESHWDYRGSAKPLEDMGGCVPSALQLDAGWTICEACGGRASYNRTTASRVHLLPADHDPVVHRWILNTALLEWLLTLEPPIDPTT